jgi:hypothetical protein
MKVSEVTRFIKNLEAHKGSLPKQTYKTIRGQAIAGDIDGAHRGLEKELNRNNKCSEEETKAWKI